MKVANKATAVRDLQRNHLQHVMKVQNMKPSIDMATPTCVGYQHVKHNAKRVQMEAERNASIERENKILLGKMYTIMNAEPAYKTNGVVSVTSLNMTVRKQEYDRIAQENQAIMRRILERKSNFCRSELDNEWKTTERYLRNISEYPFILGNLPPATRRQTLQPLAGTASAPTLAEAPEPEPEEGGAAPAVEYAPPPGPDPAEPAADPEPEPAAEEEATAAEPEAEAAEPDGAAAAYEAEGAVEGEGEAATEEPAAEEPAAEE